MKKILNLKVTAWPLIGILFVSALIYSLVAYAQNTTLQQKQFNALVSSAAVSTANAQFQLIAGFDGTNFRPLRVDATGNVGISAGGGGFTPADGVANPTGLLGVENFGMVWDGATWARMRADASDNLLVSLGTALDKDVDDITTYAFAKTTVVTGQVNCGNPATQFPTNTVKQVCFNGLNANGATPVYIGASGVNASTGYEVMASSGSCEDLDNTNRLYCFSTAGTQDVSFFATN